MQRGGRRIHLDSWVRNDPPRMAEIAMLAMAIDWGLRRGQHQRKLPARIEVRCTEFRRGDWPIACNLFEKISSLPEGVLNPCSWHLRYRVSSGARIVLSGASRSIAGVI